MSNLIVVLNVLVILGMVVSAILACHFEKLLSSVIALGATGIFAAAAFLIMNAPDVAISEAAVGAAAAIVQQNLDKTHAVNDVTSIVFDFRGYDTMGEAFILITAVAGTTVILYSGAKKKEKEDASNGK